MYKPEVLPVRPMTDLCWQCQKNTTLIQTAATLTDLEKIEYAATAVKHLTAATTEREREEYRRVVEKAKVFKFDITYNKAKTNTCTYAMVT